MWLRVRKFRISFKKEYFIASKSLDQAVRKANKLFFNDAKAVESGVFDAEQLFDYKVVIE